MAVPHLSSDPLPLDAFPKKLLRHVDPKAPPPLRDMGAKGVVPGISPDHLAMVLYNLRFDAESSIQQTAKESFADLPAEMKGTIASAELPAAVLDFCARSWLNDGTLVPTLLANDQVKDETIAFLAGKGNATITDIVADYQVRFLRAPLIIEQLYLNPNTRQSTIDRVLELAHREEVSFDGLSGLRGIAHVQETKPEALEKSEGGADDETFEKLLKDSVDKGRSEDEEGKSAEDVDKELEEDEERTVSLQVQLSNMNIAQKIRLATLGSREARAMLIRDPNRLVHMAAVQSPKITAKDMYDYADNKNLPDSVINYISNKKEAVRDYQLLIRLTRNPKLHLKRALRMLNYLRPTELKSLTRNRNVSHQLQRAAKNLLRKRQGR